jgi:hypothetical protein
MHRREAMEWDAAEAGMLDAPERGRDMPAGKVIDLLALAGSEPAVRTHDDRRSVAPVADGKAG